MTVLQGSTSGNQMEGKGSPLPPLPFHLGPLLLERLPLAAGELGGLGLRVNLRRLKSG